MKALPPGCNLRFLCPADEPALLEFFHSHSQETIFQRYHYLIAEMTHERALSLLAVDQQRDVALAVFERDSAGERIHAIARHYTAPNGQIGDMALVVRESKRRLGLATRLLHALATIAADRGLHSLCATILESNFAMRRLLDPYSARTHIVPDADVIEYFVPVPLRPHPPASPASRNAGCTVGAR